MEVMCIFAAIDILTRQDIFSTVDFAAAQTMQHAQNGHSLSGRVPKVNLLCAGVSRRVAMPAREREVNMS